MKNAELMKTKIENLNGKIEGLLKAEVNFNYNPDGYDVCLYSELSSRKLWILSDTPLHVEVKDFVGRL